MLLFIYYQCVMLLFCVCMCVYLFVTVSVLLTCLRHICNYLYTASQYTSRSPAEKSFLDIIIMLRVQRHLVRSFRPFVARRPCVRNFSGQGDEVEEEKEGPYNAETYRKRMHESGK